MPPEHLLLRFDDVDQASAMLGRIGIRFEDMEILRCDGVPRQVTGETVDFEGESLPLTTPVPGLHVRLAWDGDLPAELTPHLERP